MDLACNIFFKFCVDRLFNPVDYLREKYGKDTDRLERLHQLARKIFADIEETLDDPRNV